MTKLYYKVIIDDCFECPNRITRDLRLRDERIPQSKYTDFCKITDEELFGVIPESCPLIDYQKKIEANETGNVWVKIKGMYDNLVQ